MSHSLRLFCRVLTDDPELNQVFSVKVPLTDTVDDLKKAIRDEIKRDDLPAHQLTLWKVSIPGSDEFNQNVNNLDLTSSKPLFAMDELSEVFSDPPKRKHLHIVAQLPSASILPSRKPGSKLFHLGHENPQRLSFEHSLHKLWLDAWKSRKMLIRSHPVYRDSVCEGQDKVPKTCIALDIGDWFYRIQPESKISGVLIREEYQEAFRALIDWYKGEKNHFPTESAPETEGEGAEDAMEFDDPSVTFRNPFETLPRDITSKRGGFIALGNPGIGKTVWLCLLLVLRIHARLPTIYQFREKYFYYFHDEGVSIFHVEKPPIATEFRDKVDPSTWCLIDSNLLGTTPGFILDLGLFIVQAASPRQHRIEWTNKITTEVLHYYMKVWDIPELVSGRMFQAGTCSEANIKAFCNHYGTSAHMVYKNAASLHRQEEILTEQLQKMTYERIRKGFTSELSDFVSHHFMFISPGVTRETYSLDFPTAYIYQKIRNALSSKKMEAIAQLYDMFVNVPRTKDSAGYILEDAVNSIFHCGGEWKVVPLVSYPPGRKYVHWKNPASTASPSYLCLGYQGHTVSIHTTPRPGKTEYNSLPFKSFLPGDESLNLQDGYYCPCNRNQPTFDAFIYESNSKTATTLQMTTSLKHDAIENGFLWLQRLGVKRFRYIAVKPPGLVDILFPKDWTGPSISERYLLTIESLY